MPNSNVLLELGYAIKCLGDSKIIMIFNESSGDIEKLPFDLGLKRQMVYHCEEGQVDKANERKNLEVSITKALELIISNL
jgi:predicted nucleotide-binding protein